MGALFAVPVIAVGNTIGSSLAGRTADEDDRFASEENPVADERADRTADAMRFPVQCRAAGHGIDSVCRATAYGLIVRGNPMDPPRVASKWVISQMRPTIEGDDQDTDQVEQAGAGVGDVLAPTGLSVDGDGNHAGDGEPVGADGVEKRCCSVVSDVLEGVRGHPDPDVVGHQLDQRGSVVVGERLDESFEELTLLGVGRLREAGRRGPGLHRRSGALGGIVDGLLGEAEQVGSLPRAVAEDVPHQQHRSLVGRQGLYGGDEGQRDRFT